MESWGSYAKVWQLGHAAIRDMFDKPVLVQEKVDGSQISFGIFGNELKIKSRSSLLHVDAPDQMFAKGVDWIRRRADEGKLRDGWTYRGEYLARCRHNVLAYDRIPNGYIALFDVNDGKESYLTYDAVANEATTLGMDVVPRLYEGKLDSAADLRRFLDLTSFLGGQKIEGVVVKDYTRFTPTGSAYIGKFVSEMFKEIHGVEWKKANPGPSDFREQLAVKYKTHARWNKAIQHLREQGKLTDSPKDIGILIKEIQSDVIEECTDDIKNELFEWAAGHVRRGAVAGFAEFYKEQLLKLSFANEDQAAQAA